MTLSPDRSNPFSQCPESIPPDALTARQSWTSDGSRRHGRARGRRRAGALHDSLSRRRTHPRSRRAAATWSRSTRCSVVDVRLPPSGGSLLLTQALYERARRRGAHCCARSRPMAEQERTSESRRNATRTCGDRVVEAGQMLSDALASAPEGSFPAIYCALVRSRRAVGQPAAGAQDRSPAISNGSIEIAAQL